MNTGDRGWVIFDPFDGLFMDATAGWGDPEDAEVFERIEAARAALAEVRVAYPECVVVCYGSALAGKVVAPS